MFDNILKFCEDNWYTLLTSIPSDWDRYGNGIPSVTTILSLIYDKWFEYVKYNYKEELAEACVRWKKIHKDSEDFFDGNWTEIHKQIMKFHSLYDIEIIQQEENITKDIQWTIDLVCHIWHFIDTNMNIDYKSSKKKSKKYFLQCWWYEYLNWLRWWVLYLWKKDFDFQICPSWYKELFIELKDYFLMLLKNDNVNL